MITRDRKLRVLEDFVVDTNLKKKEINTKIY